MAVLGNTLAEIAGEKAGIIKEGIPVVTAPQTDDAFEVLKRVAKQKNSALILVGKDVKYERLTSSLDGQTMTIVLSGAERSRSADVELRIPLLGAHQIENAAVAYATLKTSGLEISKAAIQQGFSQVQWHARFEILRGEPPVIIDSAHNRDSAKRLRETLDEYFPNVPVVMVFCALEDKDIQGILEELKPRLERVVATRADHPRAPSAEWMAEQVRRAGIPVEPVTTAAEALERALELAGNQKIVLAAGSVAFAGEISAAWKNRT
jgi:dihydrofolate synthase/folylpolyglutamate synthase